MLDKKYFKIVIFQILFLVFTLLPVSRILADGMLLPYRGEDLWEPAQTALIVFDKNREDLYLRVNYEGDVSEFVWIVPTPNLPTVEKAEDKLFSELHEITKPIIKNTDRKGVFGVIPVNEGLGNDVMVYEQKRVGVFDVSVLSARDSNSLYTWLDDNGYGIPTNSKELIDWYIEKDWYFTVMKIEEEAKVELFLSDLKNKFGDDINWENASKKITDKLFEEYRGSSDKNTNTVTYNWLYEYDKDLYLGFGKDLLEFSNYRDKEIMGEQPPLERKIRSNLAKLCEIVNYDLVEDKAYLTEICTNHDEYFESYNTSKSWQEKVASLEAKDFYKEFKERIDELKKYYNDKFNLQYTRGYLSVGGGIRNYINQKIKNGEKIEDEFYQNFIKNSFDYNKGNIKKMCIDSAKEQGWDLDYAGSLFLDFDYASCSKEKGEELSEIKVSFPEFTCTTKEERNMYDWFDDCSYLDYFNSYNSINSTNHWFSINNKIEDYLEKYKQKYSGENKLRKNNSFLHPIKLSFETSSFVYPLKISQSSTKSISKYNKMIIEKYPDLAGFSDINELYDRWLDLCSVDVLENLKEDKEYNNNFAFNKVFENTEYNKSLYEKYRNRWWKYNNKEEWLINEAVEFVGKINEEQLNAIKECKVVEDYDDRVSFRDNFIEQVTSDLINKKESTAYKAYYRDYNNKKTTKCNSVIPRNIQERQYDFVLRELDNDFPYYAEEGIKNDIKNGLRNSMPVELRAILKDNNKTNEILIYIFADRKIMAPEFRLEYADWIDQAKIEELIQEKKVDLYEIEDLNEIKNVLEDKKYFLTKIRRKFAREEMDDDLYFTYAKNDDFFRMETTGRGSGDYDVSGGVFLLSESYSEAFDIIKTGKSDSKKSGEKSLPVRILGEVSDIFLIIGGLLISGFAAFGVVWYRKKKNKKVLEKVKEVDLDDKEK